MTETNRILKGVPSVFSGKINKDETMDFLPKKNGRVILSDSYINSPQFPGETPLNSTARSVNSPSSFGNRTQKRNEVTPTSLLRNRLAGSMYTKFNAGVTPAQMDPFKNSSFKITPNSNEDVQRGKLLSIDDSLEREIIQSTVRRRPFIKSVGYNTTHVLKNEGSTFLKTTTSNTNFKDYPVIRRISKFLAVICTISVYGVLLYLVFLLYKFL
uniref:LEM domain-containing protein n=1 Tax=Parastrongyloides trichosuri TaxID=131310 RepID=A0A0N4ZQN1_PARTI